MKLRVVPAIAAIVVAAFTGQASANVNTFSAVPTDVTALGSYVEDGITATTASGSMWSWPTEGQFHLDPEGFAGNSASFTFSGGLFRLVSVEISFASDGAVGTFSAFSADDTLLFTRAVDASVEGKVRFDGWSNIDHLELVDSGNHLSVDNLVLTAVPEPTSTALLLLGLGSVAFVAKRRLRG